jgi:hypothetical protein
VDEDLWIDDAFEELFLGVPGDFGSTSVASTGDIGGPWPSMRRRRQPSKTNTIGHVRARNLALGRERKKIENDRQKQIASVRDANLKKAQAALAEKRKREEQIAKERLKNLKKARKAR